MLHRSSTHRLTAWLAILAFMLGALAPAVSQWLASSGSGNVAWSEICSTSGKQQQPDGQVKQEHCPFCLIQAQAVGLPPQATITVAIIEGADALPVLFLRSPHPLFAWSPTHARAPPTLS